MSFKFISLSFIRNCGLGQNELNNILKSNTSFICLNDISFKSSTVSISIAGSFNSISSITLLIRLINLGISFF